MPGNKPVNGRSSHIRPVKNIQRLLIVTGLLALWLGAAGMGTGAVQAAGAPTGTAIQVVPNPAPSCAINGSLEGVDVSDYHGTVDWAQVAQTKAFAYARVADGATFTDPTFLTNFAGIKKAGMKAGAYFFFEPAQDPTQQANLLVSQLVKAGFAPGDLVPMFDVEVSGGKTNQEVAANLQTAINVVKNTLMVTPGITTATALWNSVVASTAFAGSPLWIAYWGVGCPVLPLGWSDYVLWQYSDLGSVPGINGAVDLERSNGAKLPVYPGSLQIFLPVIMSNK
jgi:lysozyme